MALRMGALYDALLDHTTHEKARAAAEEVANYEKDMADVRSDLKLLKWMLGAILAVELGQFIKAVFG